MHPLLGDLDAETGEPSGTMEREVDLAEAQKHAVDLVDDPWQVAHNHDELGVDGLPLVPRSRAAQAVEPTPPKSYCESCGGVGQHMLGCPTLRPPPEERFADFTAPEPSGIRRALARVLRALAKKLDG